MDPQRRAKDPNRYFQKQYSAWSSMSPSKGRQEQLLLTNVDRGRRQDHSAQGGVMMPARDEVIGSTVFVSGDGTTCKPLSPWHGAQRSDCIKPKRMEGRADDPAGMRKIAYHTLSPLKSAPQYSRPARARKTQMTLSSFRNMAKTCLSHNASKPSTGNQQTGVAHSRLLLQLDANAPTTIMRQLRTIR